VPTRSLCLLILSACTSLALTGFPGHRALAADAAPARSVWDGVYSAAQAAQGEKQYQQICQRCHGTDTRAGEEVSLWGDEFWKSWREDTVDNLYHYISANMPNDEPATLKTEQYLDVIAYLLKKNGLPAGETKLTVANAAGAHIYAKEGPGALPAETMVELVGCLAKLDKGWQLVNSSHPARVKSKQVLRAANEKAEPLAGGPAMPLKFVMTKLDSYVGKVMTVRGMLIGEGGQEGINVMTTQPSTDACEAPQS
jgi:mono/diheme cytochrome c family protein